MSRLERKLEYKQVKMLMPHCNECGEQLKGNNSMNTPYWCSCGTWKYDMFDRTRKINEYYIEKN